MNDYSPNDISPTASAGANSHQPEDRLAAVQRTLPHRPLKMDHAETLAPAAYSGEPALASERFIGEVNEITWQKERLVDHILRPSHLKWLAVISTVGLLIIAITVIIRNISEINEKITDHLPSQYSANSRPRHAGPVDSSAYVLHSVANVSPHQPEAGKTTDGKVSEKGLIADRPGTGAVSSDTGKRYFVSKRNGIPSVNTALRIQPKSLESSSPPAALRNRAEDPPGALFDEGVGDDIDKIIQFYEPVGTGKNIGRSPSKTSLRHSQRYTQEASNKSHVRRNRTRMIAEMVHSFGGEFITLLEHSGDYYKIKLSLPDDKVEPFKNALAKKTIIASFSVSTISSMQHTSTVILQMHSR